MCWRDKFRFFCMAMNRTANGRRFKITYDQQAGDSRDSGVARTSVRCYHNTERRERALRWCNR